jgi:cytochrome c-type biogenesis protein CcmH
VTSTLILLAFLLVLGIAVLAYVFWPLLRPAGRARDPSQEIALQVLRARREELMAALAHLPEQAPEREAALAEFARQIRDELDAATGDSAQRGPGAQNGPSGSVAADTPARRSMGARLGLSIAALALLLAPAMLYLVSGMPEAASPALMSEPPPANVEALISRLQSRLKEKPDDAEGWLLLGRSELARDNPAGAVEALEQARRLRPKDAATLADLADAVAQQDGRRLDGRPMALVREALSLNPDQGKALALAGAWEVTQGNPAAAIVHWTRLLAQLPPESEQARQIDGFVRDLRAGRRPGSETPASTETAAAPGPAALSGKVLLDESLRSRVPPEASLFIVARTLDDQNRPSGPPLAVIRTAAGGPWPRDFTLDDAQAMSPATRLSAQAPAARIIVIARISGTGEAALRSGDLLGSSEPVPPGARGLQITINAVAP